MSKPKIAVSREVIAAALEKTAAYLRDGKVTDAWAAIGEGFDLHYLMDEDGITAALYPVFNGATAVDYELVLLKLPPSPVLKKASIDESALCTALDPWSEEEDCSENEDYYGAIRAALRSK
jgi:hypothetical protein